MNSSSVASDHGNEAVFVLNVEKFMLHALSSLLTRN